MNPAASELTEAPDESSMSTSDTVSNLIKRSQEWTFLLMLYSQWRLFTSHLLRSPLFITAQHSAIISGGVVHYPLFIWARQKYFCSLPSCLEVTLANTASPCELAHVAVPQRCSWKHLVSLLWATTDDSKANHLKSSPAVNPHLCSFLQFSKTCAGCLKMKLT